MTLYPWLIPTYSQLTDAFLQGHGHHALLFKTENGLGSEQLIRHLAHWLLCQQPKQNEPCGQCKSCHLWLSHNHPDFHLLAPIDDRDIGIDQVREISGKLQQFSQQGGNSVVFISAAERLTEAAANALLKTLEEPNAKIYFLLQTPLPSSLLATIQSRCQTWLLHSPAPALALKWLQSECPNIAQVDLDTALRINHFRPLICKTFLESDRLTQRKTFLQTFWRFYKQRDLLLLLNLFHKEKDLVLQQLEWLSSFFNDSLKATLDIQTDWINEDLRAGIEAFSQQLSAQTILKGYRLLHQTQRELSEINAVNQELILIDCLTKLIFVFEGNEIET